MDLIQKLEEISSTIQTEFGTLNLSQLNWKANPNAWSIGQCIDHLIVSNEQYFPAFEKVVTGKYKMTFWEKNNPLTSYTGNQMIKTLGPVVVKKFQSPKLFLPSQSSIKQSIIDSFIEHQNKLIKYFTLLSDSKFEKTVITSPVAALLTLKLKDAMTILTVHEERHLDQMKRIKSQLTD